MQQSIEKFLKAVLSYRGIHYTKTHDLEQLFKLLGTEFVLDNSDVEFIEELNKNGIDPMFYFSEEIKQGFKKEVLDFPLIGGSHWNDEVILSVIREQIRKANAK